MTINVRQLRRHLVDYFGTAANSGFPNAMADLIRIERASDDELIRIAQGMGVDLEQYIEEEDLER